VSDPSANLNKHAVRLDSKQLRLINSWRKIADQPSSDSYTQFIALWIAFNAYCYAYYAVEAHRHRADLTKTSDLANIGPEPQKIEAEVRRDNRRIVINLDAPLALRISIAERYTEDHIYASFAARHSALYSTLCQNPMFVEALQTLQKVITKNGRHYVINMLKADRHNPMREFREMISDHTIIPFEDTTKLGQLKDVLYQIRCNIFHGEKVPGDLNDDRIVAAAVPVLSQLLDALVDREVRD
jgi:hypothetical protein